MENVQNTQITVPRYEVTFDKLPSRGLGYPEDAKIFYRGYTTGEMNKIATVREDALTFDFVLRSTMEGIDTEKMDKLDLSYIDVLSLGLRRRMSSEGELKFRMPYMCEGCGKASVLVFDQTDLKFNSISETIKIDGEDVKVQIPITVPIKDLQCEFWYPTVRNMLDAGTKKGKEKINVLKALTVKNQSFPVMYDIFNKLSDTNDIADVELLELVDKALYHDIASIESKCKNEVLNEDTDQKAVCNHTQQVSIEGKELLIKPFRESKAPVRDKVRFGNQRDSGQL